MVTKYLGAKLYHLSKLCPLGCLRILYFCSPLTNVGLRTSGWVDRHHLYTPASPTFGLLYQEKKICAIAYHMGALYHLKSQLNLTHRFRGCEFCQLLSVGVIRSQLQMIKCPQGSGFYRISLLLQICFLLVLLYTPFLKLLSLHTNRINSAHFIDVLGLHKTMSVVPSGCLLFQVHQLSFASHSVYFAFFSLGRWQRLLKCPVAIAKY